MEKISSSSPFVFTEVKKFQTGIDFIFCCSLSYSFALYLSVDHQPELH